MGIENNRIISLSVAAALLTVVWASVPVAAIPPTASIDFNPPATITTATALSATSTSTVCCPDQDMILHERWRLQLLTDPTPDAVGPDTTTVIEDKHFFVPDAPGSTYNFNVPDDGEYRLYLKVWDEDGESDETFVDFTVVNRRPFANFAFDNTAPSTADTVTATDASTDADGIIVDWSWTLRLLEDPTPDGIADTPGIIDTASGSSTYSFGFPDDGKYRVTLTVTDDDGDTRTRHRTIWASNIAPTGAMLDINPELAAYRVGDNIRYDDLSDQAFPDVDGVLTTAEFSDSDGFFATAVAGGFAAKELPAGPCERTVTLTVYDDDGDSASVSKNIVVDGAAPVTTVGLPAPSNGWHSGEVSASIARSDDCSGVEWTQLTLDGDVQYVRGDRSFGVTVAGDGAHTLAVQSRDVARNVETAQTFTINIDGTGPSVDLQQPCVMGLSLICALGFGGTALSGDDVQLTATAMDALSGIDTVTFLVDGTEIASFSAEPDDTYEAVWSAQGFGPHMIEVVATDLAGNSRTDSTVLFVVE